MKTARIIFGLGLLAILVANIIGQPIINPFPPASHLVPGSPAGAAGATGAPGATGSPGATGGLVGICALGNQSGTVTLDDSSCSGALTGSLPWGLVTMTANGAITLAAPTFNSGLHQINITQDGTGGRVVTFNAAFANVPQQVTVAGTLNWYAFFWTGTATVATSGGNTSGLTQCGTQAAPGSNPPSNTVYVHCDSTTGAPQSVDSSGNVKNYVKDLAATASNFLTSIVNGVPTKAQPAFTDISGAATGAQLPATAVQTNQANTYSTGAQDFGSATSLKVPVGAGAAPATNGQIAYDSTAQMLHAAQSSADAKVPQFTVTPANGDCANWVVSGSQYKLGTLGSACGSASAAPVFPVNPQTSTYQVLAADFTACKNITVASGTFTVTLVASGSQPTNGQCLWVTNYGSGVVTIARSGQNINGAAANLTLPAASASAPTGAWIDSDGTNYFAATYGPSSGVTLTIASGTSALATSAISSATCATVVTTSATGTATTDNIMADFNADPTGVTGYVPSASGMLTIIKYPSSNNVNFKVCNNTASSITPGAITLNWRVVR